MIVVLCHADVAQWRRREDSARLARGEIHDSTDAVQDGAAIVEDR